MPVAVRCVRKDKFMEQKEFLEMIKASQRRLNLAGFLHKLVPALGIGAVVGILFQVMSLIIPLYYANWYMVMGLVLAVTAATVVAYMKRCSMAEAALVMDGFGFQERIVTAFENLKSEGAIYALQRADAMARLKADKDRIRIKLMPPKKQVFITLGLLAVMVGLVFVPSTVRQQARELHEIQKAAKEKEEEIEEVLESLENLEEQELTEEQIQALQEMRESLQSSMAEYGQATSSEQLSAAGEKLNYKYQNMSEQLAQLAQSMQNGGASPMSAQAMQAMADKMQQMSGNMSGSQMASNQNGQNGSGNGQNNGQSGQNGNGQSGQNGQPGQNGQSGQNGNGQSGQNGSGGNGSGQNGNGNGNNGGNGTGSGNGRGTGSANIARDYVSVPNAIADVGNLTGNATNHDNSEYFSAPNGMSWEGTHVSYENVIGSYEQNAYEGIATGQYPSGMEDVIKDYFASFNS